MKRVFLKLFFSLAVAAGMSGCMTVKDMPLRTDAAQVEMKNDTMLLFSARIVNKVAPLFQPKIITAIVIPEGAKDYAQWLSFRPQGPYAESDTGIKDYLLSVNLAPGKYTIHGMRGLASAFPFHGMCELPLNAAINIDQSGQVLYLGHINATIRERKDDEVRAGSLFPLLDQAASGMSGGTFDVSIEDRFDVDTERYRKTYASIRTANIRKAILPAWVRPVDAPVAKQ
jgi:hypothetical protein